MPHPDPDTLSQLNAILRHMLTGINQFFLHARMLKHQGQLKLADYTYKSSIDAMKFSDMLVEHVLTLGGSPNMQDLEKLTIGQESAAMLANDCAHAEAGLVLLRAAVAHCGENNQKTTAELLTRIAENQQEHVYSLRALLSSLQPIKDCA